MAAEDKSVARTTIATVVATAAVTLAIGVTSAALTGYLVPADDARKTRPERVADPVTVERPPAPTPSAPNVVLVPVAQNSRGGEPGAVAAQPEPEVRLATYEPTEHEADHDDRRRGRKHDEGEHEDEHDD